MINTIIQGHSLNVLPQLPAESVNCVTTSPPYWGLRDYGIEPVIWDGDKDCEHIWGEDIAGEINNNNATEQSTIHRGGYSNKGLTRHIDYKSNFCLKCNAWRGSLGLEPTFDLYIKHLCDIFDEVKKVLRKDGTCFVNMGDSYWGAGQGGADYGGKEIVSSSNFGHIAKGKNYPNKSLCCIPDRFKIEMINRGWILRNVIIWWKPNCMPSSADDRFTVDFEYLFYFTKNNKTLFWTNEKTLECISKKPLGIKGIEGKDWEWRPCPACSDKDYFNIRTRDVIKKEKDCPQFKASDKEKENIKNKICPRCKGLKKVKYSFWSGHDIWFEQQFEKYDYPLNRWGGDIQKSRTEKKTIYEKVMKLGRTSKLVEGTVRPNPIGRNKRCVWIDNSNYEIIVNNKNGENIFKAANIPQEEIIKCFGHWFNGEQNIKGTTWKIPTQPFPEAHFAVYPEELIETPIKAGCPEYICKKCGKARVKILEPTEKYKEYLGKDNLKEHHAGQETKTKFKVKTNAEYKIKGYTDCGCNAGWESGITLDPFMGSGTTAREALKQRKRFIGIEIKQSYIDMSYRKIAKLQPNLF